MVIALWNASASPLSGLDFIWLEIKRNGGAAARGYQGFRQLTWLLRRRQEEWQKLASCKLQFGKLCSASCLKVQGVIYALFLSGKFYVGQTVNSALHRASQHIRTALSQSRVKTEVIISPASGPHNYWLFP